jgi:hypothetical protein
MPKTILSLNAEELTKLELLRTPFVDLPFFNDIDQDLVQRARELYKKRKDSVYCFNKDIRAGFCRAMRTHLHTQPCTILEALQSDEVYTRLTGREQEYWPENRDKTEACWWHCYNPLFEAWQVDHGLEMFTSWEHIPTHVAGYYHLQEYGDQDLRARQFDEPMALALLYDVLHEAGVVTLAQLAALTVTELYPLIRKCGYSQENETLRQVRMFLRRHHIDINTIIADEPPT